MIIGKLWLQHDSFKVYIRAILHFMKYRLYETMIAVFLARYNERTTIQRMAVGDDRMTASHRAGAALTCLLLFSFARVFYLYRYSQTLDFISSALVRFAHSRSYTPCSLCDYP